MDVKDVVAALAQLIAQREDRGRRQRDDGHRSVRRYPDGAPERDQMIGLRAALRARATVKATRARVIRAEAREDARVVAPGGKLGGERLDVPAHAPRLCP